MMEQNVPIFSLFGLIDVSYEHETLRVCMTCFRWRGGMKTCGMGGVEKVKDAYPRREYRSSSLHNPHLWLQLVSLREGCSRQQ